jgi:glutamate dehydrogenase/leucine dehydrogenase
MPAALGNQIHAGNASNIKASLIVEGANNPTTPAADEILRKRGIHVLPDIVANAGGVTVSYYEWVQNQANEQWDAEQVDEKLKSRMYAAVDTVFSRWQSYVVGDQSSDDIQTAHMASEDIPDFRTIALAIAIERVTEATLLRGIWP